MRRWLITVMVLAGCSDPAVPSDVPAPVQPAALHRTAPAAPPLDPSPVEPPALTDADLDAMDEPALEAACFAGSSAACDRLGH